jgi:hypothetical protein
MNFDRDGQFGPGRLKRPDLNRSRYSIFGATAEAPLFVYPAKLVYATYEQVVPTAQLAIVLKLIMYWPF